MATAVDEEQQQHQTAPIGGGAEQQKKRTSVALKDRQGVRASSQSADRLSRPMTRMLTSSSYGQSDGTQEEEGEEGAHRHSAAHTPFEDVTDTVSVRSRTLTTPNLVSAPNGSGGAKPHRDDDDDRDSSDNDASNSDDADKFQDADDDVHTEDSDMQDEKMDDQRQRQQQKQHPKTDRQDSEHARKISMSSNMDNVSLGDDATAAAAAARGDTADGDGAQPLPLPPPPPPPAQPESPEVKASSDKEPPSTKTLSLSSITGALPSLSWGSSPSADPSAGATATTAAPSLSTAAAASAQPQSGPLPRKLTSPFSWLSRNTTQKEIPSPPQASPRRNTASSVATMTSNPELMLGRLEEDRGGESSRSSLRDRFQQLRMRSEGPGAESGDEISISNNNSLSLGLSSASGEDEAAAAAAAAAAARERSLAATKGPPPSPVPPSPNPSLAPGTASGVEVGPSAMSEGSVDWDLWQSVVYEGPAAVARSSPEELNRAISTGIPSAIRGVIWQVLAQSSNEGLEAVYSELSTRGAVPAADRPSRDRNSNSTTLSSASNGRLSMHGEGIQGQGQGQSQIGSSASSVQSSDAAEKRRKEREDAATLQKLEKAIRRDMGTRTSYSKYAAAEGLQDGLFGVCKAYALFDEDVGYAQGMNFLVMPLLFSMPEEEAFCLLVRLMNHYGLRDLFVNDMPGLHMRLYQFERLLEDFEPALYCHLHRRGISSHLYATQWFLTLFSYRFPLQLVLRIYDLIFSEGLSAILRFGLVLMRKNAAALLAMRDMQQLTTFLKDRVFDVYIDRAPSAGSLLENGFFGSSTASLDKEVYHADQLVRDACEIRLAPSTLEAYTAEWEEKTRVERDREAELDRLRSSNTGFAIRIRRLEERIEAVDREQATMATEMVHTKVENQELKDENESLRGQVRELRLVIEKQPAELELAWQAERDDLIKRNTNVHEENQRVEKEMAELEEELVQTKMRWAELNSQHEALNRKWSDLRRQFA